MTFHVVHQQQGHIEELLQLPSVIPQVLVTACAPVTVWAMSSRRVVRDVGGLTEDRVDLSAGGSPADALVGEQIADLLHRRPGSCRSARRCPRRPATAPTDCSPSS